MLSRHRTVALRPHRLRAGLSPLALLLALGGAATAQVSGAPDAPASAKPPRVENLTSTAPATPAVQAIAPSAADATPAPAAAPAKKSRELPPLVVARVSADPVPTLSPSTFLDTLRMADHYQAMVDAGGWSALPADLVVKPGASHPSIPALRKHLALVGDLAADAPVSDQLDAPLAAAVKAFQARHGLPETGLIGRQTVAALNVPAATRQRQLAASAARQIGSNFAYGDRYVVVNIPSATVEAVDHGVVVRRYVAVVGKPDKATPRIEARITDVNLNPTWTLPVSIIKKEIIPKMRKDPGYLARERIRILGPGGVEVDPTAIDWSSEKAANYTLRQDSGLENSLGQVRIDMPNKQAVYMHDTPSKSLFAREVRFHSHGCVRVAQVKELAGWLLEGTPGPNGPGSTWGPIEIETSIATNERLDIKLPKQIPVTFVYLTGYATPDGRAHFRDDIYGIDSPAVPMPDVAATGTIVSPKPKAAPSPASPARLDTGRSPAQKPDTAKPDGSRPEAVRPEPARAAPARSASDGPVPPGLIPTKGPRPAPGATPPRG
ncbi:peptidoglycan-binding protein [Methylobacterium sp. Leaf104]|uniref:L,D-transpeptidase family protein n=1 Tax=Methylobacterium TaxID=407 RepID=UPI0006FF5150|nr:MULTISPECIES: L,D-transpeptidase family protein [Methylobacterium]KQP38221.1 peptidoglycan-binding protein [Methylobacterium sp. Leaf104]MCI9880400.1 L,D-transpeptidase family protein [Methylobacterium goesingense]